MCESVHSSLLPDYISHNTDELSINILLFKKLHI